MRSKALRLKDLVEKRRSEHSKIYDGYKRLNEFHQTRYECDFVVPWTKSACNTDANVMIIAQDWGSEEFLASTFKPKMAELGYDETLPTNKNLFNYLNYLNLNFQQTYATDIFPFIKPGPMSAKISMQVLICSAADYTLPQIEIINPRIVICLGISTFNAICTAIAMQNGEPKPKRLSWRDYEKQAVPSEIKYNTAEIYAVTHLGAWSSRRRMKIEPEWKMLSKRLNELLNC